MIADSLSLSLSLSFSLLTESTPCSYRSPRDLLLRIYKFYFERWNFNIFSSMLAIE